MPHPDVIPIPRDGFRLEQVEGETLIYQHSQKKLIYLNESAAAVWHLCDGQRTIRNIIDLLADAYPEDATTVAADVSDAINSLVREDALQISNKPARASSST